MRFTQSEKNALKKPLGELWQNSRITRTNLLNFLGDCKFIVTVGDDTTCALVRLKITPTISITDGKTKRSNIKLTKDPKYDPLLVYLRDVRIPEYKCKNPAGYITQEACRLVTSLIQMRKPSKIIVDGEEDLLAIPMFAHLPKNSVLVYGQPNEGMVLTRINSAIQNMAKDLLTRFYQKE
jgi:uncharacterized protein (UPF0218 family)